MKSEILCEETGKIPFDKNQAYYCYIIVRSDIPVGMQAAQIAHAALVAGSKHEIDEGLRVSILAAADKEELEYTSSLLGEDGVDHIVFHEPDWNIGFSAIATAPILRKKAKKLSKLPLWKG